MRTGYPCAFTETSNRYGRLAAHLLFKEFCAEKRRGFLCVLAVQLKIAVLSKADQRVGLSLFDCLIFAEFCDGERRSTSVLSASGSLSRRLFCLDSTSTRASASFGSVW